MIPSLPLPPSPGPSLPRARSWESTALSSLEFLPEVPFHRGEQAGDSQGHNIKRGTVVWGRVTRGLRMKAMVLNVATNELCDLSKRLDLSTSQVLICKRKQWIAQFLKFSPAVEIIMSRISTICKTAIFKSGPHLQQFLTYGGLLQSEFLEGKKHPSTNWFLLSLLKHFVVSHGLSREIANHRPLDSSVF